MKPDGRNLTAVVRGIYDENGVSVESAPHPQQKLADVYKRQRVQFALVFRKKIL